VPRSENPLTSTVSDGDRRRAGGAPTRAPHLFAVLHCDEPHLGGARWGLAATREIVFTRATELGSRRDGETLTIGLPHPFVSRVHARLLRDRGGAWTVTDEGSRNGTFLNGERIRRATLKDRDVLAIGHTLFVFRADLPAPAGTAEADEHLLAGTELATLLPELHARHAAVRRVAYTDVPVLLLGESGAGKEVLARAIHKLSGRGGAFVPVNCGALPRGLVESHLFGHRKGAFSGAHRDEPGFFRAADRGTILLDEIGDLPLDAQTALLRVLEDRVVVPVGSASGVTVEVRVIAATHQSVREHIDRGTFRRDLYARLSGFVFQVLPLRERMEDLGLLVSGLLAELAPRHPVSIEVEAGLELLRHDWPLNVRELRNCLAASLALAEDEHIDEVHLPGAESSTASAAGEDLEQRLVALLGEHRGNVSAVARALGKAPTQVNRWLRRFRIDAAAFRNRV
jgi:transcriptional regulator of acetoin/glycerol metabolism